MDRRDFIRVTAAGILTAGVAEVAEPSRQRRPNIVLIYADDLGYGDLGCYGSAISTPNIDRLSREGMRFTHFYSASPVCSPSRAALMTGRYPSRVGIPSVLFPEDTYGLPLTEMTMAELVKSKQYQTMCLGKWHLGTIPESMPTNRGFDEFFGMPYSNDQAPSVLMSGMQVIEEPVQLDTLTERYTTEAVNFIRRCADSPFFLYLAHTFPHIPLAASPRFRGKSNLGLYADVIQELDWSTGEVLRCIQDCGLDQDTLVIFSSDNGPWFQGSSGGLRGRKGETWDGGMRMPMLARFPGQISRGSVFQGLATTMDLFPTVASLSGAALPEKPLDGVDIWPILSGEKPQVPRDVFIYMRGWDIQCARWGSWKLHVTRSNTPAWAPMPAEGLRNLPLPQPELYNMERDVDESYDVAAYNPGIVADIWNRIEALVATFPQAIQDTWRETLSLRVRNTPSGALPVEAE